MTNSNLTFKALNLEPLLRALQGETAPKYLTKFQYPGMEKAPQIMPGRYYN